MHCWDASQPSLCVAKASGWPTDPPPTDTHQPTCAAVSSAGLPSWAAVARLRATIKAVGHRPWPGVAGAGVLAWGSGDDEDDDDDSRLPADCRREAGDGGARCCCCLARGGGGTCLPWTCNVAQANRQGAGAGDSQEAATFNDAAPCGSTARRKASGGKAGVTWGGWGREFCLPRHVMSANRLCSMLSDKIPQESYAHQPADQSATPSASALIQQLLRHLEQLLPLFFPRPPVLLDGFFHGPCHRHIIARHPPRGSSPACCA